MVDLCSIEGCERLQYARGLCHLHYRRQRLHGDPGSAEIRQYGRKTCSIEGCDGKHFSIGLCSKHHQRWRRYGDPTVFVGSQRSEVVKNPAVHWRLRQDRGLPKDHLCQHCGEQAAQWAYDHADPNELMDEEGPYSLNQSHYMPLCCSCHTKFDKRAKAGVA